MGKKRLDSKFDRKFEKKVQFYSKVKDAVTSLSTQKSITKKKKKSKQQRRQNKLKAYNLSSLLESLPEVKSSKKPVCENDGKLKCKSRQILVLTERDRISAVLNDPNFRADPLSAIHQYIQSKQLVVEEQPKKKVNKNGSKKKKKSKASTGLQSMEM
ncbi:hypothetical protein AAZX31_20G115400 [Glycine max]|uniref:Ribosome biogenesis protein slx9-like n=2 Tax=Glycine subgen. Soja TaxID=1462606 RepID=I1NFW3_SOYBN|nr:uncharacterized protein LOC100802777 [Glycine max]XP_028222256.1 uncharacterized protein LOC114403459 [Glycine soja]KAG4907603.1 hypothetical protein JHK86_056087 [Glycine max]KAG5074903.1 hypothetical protein JHK84_056134 [Glycine max]KAH1190786.1 hypothetical protein GmHk_20G058236 [Glycine max]KRG91006.1 hypothetical protein GLYMA_20G127400v4 [Glycine max]RZB43654.1 hypothetical protein D0Y65_053944 [Glycine soja]|eukprot:XP_006605970.1 uncharacterized protein LOC100802777 [Glycine max]